MPTDDPYSLPKSLSYMIAIVCIVILGLSFFTYVSTFKSQDCFSESSHQWTFHTSRLPQLPHVCLWFAMAQGGVGVHLGHLMSKSGLGLEWEEIPSLIACNHFYN